MVAPPDLNREIDEDAVMADVREIIRLGLRSLTFAGLTELPFFVTCHALKPGAKIASWDNFVLSSNQLRQKITRLVHEMPETEVPRNVAEALLGMDAVTADLEPVGRQDEAARRHSPAKPISRTALRNKPYGLQWKLISYLTESLIKSEEVARWRQTADVNDWTGRTGGQLKTDLLSFPSLPSDSEWEAALGYRWLHYERLLTCSPDLAVLTFTTRVGIRITTAHTRLFLHLRQAKLDAVLSRLEAPTITVSVERESSAAVFLGTVQYSSRHPYWLVDYFDFGPGTAINDEILLVFEHSYPNPHHDPPVHVVATPEFDELDKFIIRAEHLSDDGQSRTVLNGPLYADRPPRGKPQTLFVQPPYEFVRYQLRDQADWPRVQELEAEIARLRGAVTELDYELNTYFEVLSAPMLDE
jgi:hypothetical protein